MSAKLLGLTGLLVIGLTAPARAQQGALTLADRRLTPGAMVTLTGSRFLPGSILGISLEGNASRAALGSVTAGAQGGFNESLRVPANVAPGAYRLVARAGGANVAGLDVAVLADSTAPAAPTASAQPGAARMPGMSHDSQPAARDTDAVASPRAATSGTIFGYDWGRLHAALNDLPAALLLVSVLFDLAGAIRKREDFRTVGFWTLIVGVLGTGAAVIAGLKAEASVEHSDEAHAVMEVHQTMGLIVLGVFGILALWRLARRRNQSRPEQTVAALVGLAGLAVLVRTARLGGTLMFDHALGIPTARLHVLEGQRESEDHEHGAEPSHDMPHADSMPMRADTTGSAHPETATHKHSH